MFNCFQLSTCLLLCVVILCFQISLGLNENSPIISPPNSTTYKKSDIREFFCRKRTILLQTTTSTPQPIRDRQPYRHSAAWPTLTWTLWSAAQILAKKKCPRTSKVGLPNFFNHLECNSVLWQSCWLVSADLAMVFKKGLMYKGIYWPSLTNSFKCKRLEMAYLRYSHRQRQKSLIIVNIVDLLLKVKYPRFRVAKENHIRLYIL